ncbi:hypothetical protein Poly30_32820 [Planctomycetes bacterium Poly30]|uniref:Uncharacterized protein n=1 Tax=Saltatorellus ferox TaxID=2528018 RepID=A0A518EUI6_9BACT|nr:hypothetical protein Poly30_32820 [Planctomycetes bacterium Poly30]
MLDLPFSQRILALALLLAMVSGIELSLRGKGAVRWRYSLFVLATGFLGAAYGGVHDALTVQISPEYFSVLERLGSKDLEARAISLGAQAGFSFGAIAAVLLAYLSERRRPAGGEPELVSLVACWRRIALFAFVFSAIGGVGAYAALSDGWTSRSLPTFNARTGRRLLTVWVVHWCTYVGGGAGLYYCVRDRTWLPWQPSTYREGVEPPM